MDPITVWDVLQNVLYSSAQAIIRNVVVVAIKNKLKSRYDLVDIPRRKALFDPFWIRKLIEVDDVVVINMDDIQSKLSAAIHIYLGDFDCRHVVAIEGNTTYKVIPSLR